MRTLNKRSYGVHVHPVHSNQRNKRSYGVYVYSVHSKIRSGKWNFMFEAKSRFEANYMHFTVLFGGDDILIFS